MRKLIDWIKNLWAKGIMRRTVSALAVAPIKEKKVVSNGSPKTKMYLNDPTTPDLIIEEEVGNTLLKMNSTGDQGGGFPLGSIQQQASACKGMVNSILKYVASKTRQKTIRHWAVTSSMNINARAGKDINAYYDRGSLKFFYFGDKVTRKNVFACDSRSVVSHEFGHAYLDILRPDLWSTQAAEIWAFHEAFGDMIALLASLQYDVLIQNAIEETQGDLMKSNILTRLAAEMGIGVYHLSDGKGGVLPNCLRDMSIVFKYTEPEKLPSDGPDNVIINECHSFSRIFSGAFYEMIVKMSDQNMKNGQDQMTAIKNARDTAAEYLMTVASSTPSTVRFFDAAARQFLQADKSNGGKYQDVIRKVFLGRAILPKETVIKMLDVKDVKDVVKDIKDMFELQLHGNERVLRTLSVKRIKLSDHGVQAQSNNPLYNLEIDVPCQAAYYFDENNQLTDIVQAQDTEIIDAAYSCLDYLHKNNMVGDHDQALFSVKKDRLVRKQIVCKCGKPNYCDPNAPEYGKPWKPANNAGCAGCHSNCEPRSCDCEPETTPTPPAKKGCYTSVRTGGVRGYKVGQFISRKVC